MKIRVSFELIVDVKVHSDKPLKEFSEEELAVVKTIALDKLSLKNAGNKVSYKQIE